MISKLMGILDGKKSYTAILVWVLYKIANSHWGLPEMPDLEVAILGVAGLSMREAISKKG